MCKGKDVGAHRYRKVPGFVDEKARIGDFKADTIVGKDQKSRLLVAVEKKKIRRHPQNRRLQSKRAAARSLKPFKSMIHAITLDNGKEFYRHAIFAEALEAQTYFCHLPFLEKGFGGEYRQADTPILSEGDGFQKSGWQTD